MGNARRFIRIRLFVDADVRRYVERSPRRRIEMSDAALLGEGRGSAVLGRADRRDLAKALVDPLRLRQEVFLVIRNERDPVVQRPQAAFDKGILKTDDSAA